MSYKQNTAKRQEFYISYYVLKFCYQVSNTDSTLSEKKYKEWNKSKVSNTC